MNELSGVWVNKGWQTRSPSIHFSTQRIACHVTASLSETNVDVSCAWIQFSICQFGKKIPVFSHPNGGYDILIKCKAAQSVIRFRDDKCVSILISLVRNKSWRIGNTCRDLKMIASHKVTLTMGSFLSNIEQKSLCNTVCRWQPRGVTWKLE